MLVGRIGRPHGLDGQVAVHPETDNPDRFRRGAVVQTRSGDRLVVERTRRSDDALLVRFAGRSDRAAAESLRGEELFIPEEERRPLRPGEFWPDQLVGLAVRAPDGALLGTVSDLVEGAAQDRLVVDTPEGPVEVPFVEELVPEVNPADGFLVVVPIDGLFIPPPATG